jgi:hypothetical protein
MDKQRLQAYQQLIQQLLSCADKEEPGILLLLEVLKATAENEYNPEVVYPLLAANTDKLNLNFAKLLHDNAKKY